MNIPREIEEALVRYRDGNHPYAFGSFLTAVLANDLVEAVLRADDHNIRILPQYVMWIRNNLPGRTGDAREDMWGSYDAVKNTIKRQYAAWQERA